MNMYDWDPKGAARADRILTWARSFMYASAGLAFLGLLGYGVAPAVKAAFVLPATQGPFLGDNNVNPFTLAKAINEFNQHQTRDTLTATASGTQANSLQLSYGFNEVSVVATTADGVDLPRCVNGAIVFVANTSANSMTVFGLVGTTDTINGTAGATGVAQANAARALYFCYKTGAWLSLRGTS